MVPRTIHSLSSSLFSYPLHPLLSLTKQVHSLLFAEDMESRIEGIRRCEMWAHRGRLPAAIEATLVVLTAETQDRHGHTEPLQLRMAYSMALTRFVNHVVDMSQRGKYASSISTLAANVELPRLFVDLRQDATHGILPALSVLRMASQRALVWIRSRYWARQVSLLEASASKVAEAPPKTESRAVWKSRSKVSSAPGLSESTPCL